jgi:hypothetical protein
LLNGAPSDGVVLLSTIDGTAGVGKSTLAVPWAHQMRNRFPDGELYVNLRSFDPAADPMTSADALASFLAALDIPSETFPPSGFPRTWTLAQPCSAVRCMASGCSSCSITPVPPSRYGQRSHTADVAVPWSVSC